MSFFCPKCLGLVGDAVKSINGSACGCKPVQTTYASNTHKYVVHPGLVRSQHDGNSHHISFNQLVTLHRLNPNECLNAARPEDILGVDLSNLKHIHPRPNGSY